MFCLFFCLHLINFILVYCDQLTVNVEREHRINDSFEAANHTNHMITLTPLCLTVGVMLVWKALCHVLGAMASQKVPLLFQQSRKHYLKGLGGHYVCLGFFGKRQLSLYVIFC